MARTDRGLQVRAGRGPLARRALFRPDPQAGAAGLLLRLCAPGSPPLGHPGPRRVGSAAAVGEGRAAGAPGNMAARPSSAASRPPVPEMRLGREEAAHLLLPSIIFSIQTRVVGAESSDEGEIAAFPPTRTRAPRRPPAGCTFVRTPSHPYPHTREHTHRGSCASGIQSINPEPTAARFRTLKAQPAPLGSRAPSTRGAH
ncbi:uncharacterized protein LOC113835543 isoform X2 [Cricetulus griseus]|uniref:Uncharacterized protein LOC113835543 isoform X2 n=1 Tax=Cricetulus griseus TaxID=10029 RepID=A0A9J7FY82_CRIGR|nr:uncharacterized protein LOC113835543 isoform X2 [Cricetulus griseus]